ncbi:MAG: zinc dependent phospholipase C family protein [Syntrophobacterales bacterium]|nr:zinc dependent phospholipase C family protein [Syntrophobacterales bacterium]
MPKEIVHLHLADHLWEVFQSTVSVKLSTVGKILFLIGSLLPDSFFYSPFYIHYSMGEELHRFEGKAFYDLAKNSIWVNATPEERAMLAGMITHFLADGYWHPTINDIAKKTAEKSQEGFSQVFYHRLLESFMQAYLIPRSEQDSRIEWLKSNYSLGIPVATSLLSKLATSIGRKHLSPADVRTVILCHEISLRALHSSLIRSKRTWLLKVSSFQSFSPLIPPPPDEKLSFLSSVSIEAEKIEFIFSKESLGDYLRLVSTLFRELP